MHKLTFRWTYPDGRVVDTGTFPFLRIPILNPGRHEFFVEVSDGRGGTARDSIVVTVTPSKEIVLHIGDMWSTFTQGNWQRLADSTAASGIALHDVNAGAPKVTTPLANPSSYADIGFAADPTQTYKLWVRLKADGNQPVERFALAAVQRRRRCQRQDVRARIDVRHRSGARGVLRVRRVRLGLAR